MPAISDSTQNNKSLNYDSTNICGWDIRYQPGIWEFCPPLREHLTQDLKEISSLLPADILSCIRTTRIYINKTFRYPDQSENILGACLHQSAEWLKENGNLVEKEGHVEIYDCCCYLGIPSMKCLFSEIGKTGKVSIII